MRYYGKIENDYDLVNKKYVDNNAASIPTIPITAAMIIGTDPAKIQFSDEQIATIKSTPILVLDGTAVGEKAYFCEVRHDTDNWITLFDYQAAYMATSSGIELDGIDVMIVYIKVDTKQGIFGYCELGPIPNSEIDTLFT